MAQYSGPPINCQDLANKYAAQYGIPASLLYQLLVQESKCNPNAVSSAGAKGVAQIVPKYHPVDQYGNPLDPYNPDQSVSYAAYLLKSYYDKYKSYALALAAYNAGQGNVNKYGGIPPFNETIEYVKTILRKAGLPIDTANVPKKGQAPPQSGANPTLPSAQPSAQSNPNFRKFLIYGAGFLLIIIGIAAAGKGKKVPGKVEVTKIVTEPIKATAKGAAKATRAATKAATEAAA